MIANLVGQYGERFKDRLNLSQSLNLSPYWPTKFAIIVWHIWCYRNCYVFDKACLRTQAVWQRSVGDIADVFKMQDSLYNTEQRIISWKPPLPPGYKLNVDAYQSDDQTFAIGATVIRDGEFKWFWWITRKIISPCLLEIILLTLREALLQAWSYQLSSLELDLDRDVIEELQAGPLTCRSYLRTVISEVRDLLNRNWQVTLNYVQHPVNLVFVVLAALCKEQHEVLVIHAEPPDSLVPALDLDHDTYLYAQCLQDEDQGNLTAA